MADIGDIRINKGGTVFQLRFIYGNGGYSGVDEPESSSTNQN